MSAWIFKNKVVWLVVWVVGMVAVDQASKLWAQANLSEERDRLERVELPSASSCTAPGPDPHTPACTDYQGTVALDKDATGAVLTFDSKLGPGATASAHLGASSCDVDVEHMATKASSEKVKCTATAMSAPHDGWVLVSMDLPGEGARDVDVKATGTASITVEARSHVHEPLPGKQVVAGLFSLKYAENRAAAFSLTQSIPEGARRPMLLMVSLLACALIAVWYMKLKVADGLLMTSFALIIAGALGNFLDRARLAYVIDFLDFYVANEGVASWLRSPHSFMGINVRLSDHWPTFNIADSCIVSGAIGVVLRTLKPLPIDKSAGAE